MCIISLYMIKGKHFSSYLSRFSLLSLLLSVSFVLISLFTLSFVWQPCLSFHFTFQILHLFSALPRLFFFFSSFPWSLYYLLSSLLSSIILSFNCCFSPSISLSISLSAYVSLSILSLPWTVSQNHTSLFPHHSFTYIYTLIPISSLPSLPPQNWKRSRHKGNNTTTFPYKSDLPTTWKIYTVYSRHHTLRWDSVL